METAVSLIYGLTSLLVCEDACLFDDITPLYLRPVNFSCYAPYPERNYIILV